MRLPIYQLDAFAAAVFSGNPAAVCPLAEWLPEAVMQKIAAENNLSETAFFTGGNGNYAIRWFTPTVEADLCGHATLASGYVAMTHLEPRRDRVSFASQKAGMLAVAREGDLFTLDFPARPAKPVVAPERLERALGARPSRVLATARDYLCVFPDARTVEGLVPDFAILKTLDRAVCVTAPGEDGVDYVLRFFAPTHGIDEDPATGSAQCTLAPYWAQVLGRTALVARQVSRRVGEFRCTLAGDRVRIAGRVAPYLEGHIDV